MILRTVIGLFAGLAMFMVANTSLAPAARFSLAEMLVLSVLVAMLFAVRRTARS